jgi:hypothetical protein
LEKTVEERVSADRANVMGRGKFCQQDIIGAWKMGNG